MKKVNEYIKAVKSIKKNAIQERIVFLDSKLESIFLGLLPLLRKNKIRSITIEKVTWNIKGKDLAHSKKPSVCIILLV